MTETVNGTVEQYADWIRTMHCVQPVFAQVVQGYARLRQAGYCHCNLSLETLLLQIRPAAGNPVKPSLVVKLTGFEQAVEAGSELISPSDGNLKGDSSYMAPEVGARVWDEA